MTDPRFPPGAIVRRDVTGGEVWRVVGRDRWRLIGEHPSTKSATFIDADPHRLLITEYVVVPDDEVPEHVWVELAKLRLQGGV